MDFVEGSVHLRQWKTSNRNGICSMSLELSLHDLLVFTSFIAENRHCHVRAEETSSKKLRNVFKVSHPRMVAGLGSELMSF